jgi:hypothetical protein
MYSPVRNETWQFWQIIYAKISTFPFTAIGIMPLLVVKHLIYLLGGTVTFP